MSATNPLTEWRNIQRATIENPFAFAAVEVFETYVFEDGKRDAQTIAMRVFEFAMDAPEPIGFPVSIGKAFSNRPTLRPYSRVGRPILVNLPM